MKKYNQLTREQRYQIAIFKQEKKSIDAIALLIGVHRSTIFREIIRNTGKRGYRFKQADEISKARKCAPKNNNKITGDLKRLIYECIEKDWSPEQISGYLKKEKGISISHESIYQFILQDKKDGGTLHLHLRRNNKKYKKRYGSIDKRGMIPNKVSIDDRPKIVDEKMRYGDWEVDLVSGANHKGFLVTAVERKSKFTLIEYVENKTAASVSLAIKRLLAPFKPNVLTITCDNGKEFAFHEDIAAFLNAAIFFAHVYCSWERGLNENTNGLIRQYVPKKTIIDPSISSKLPFIMNALNTRPRKTLNFDFPEKVFYDGINYQICRT